MPARLCLDYTGPGILPGYPGLTVTSRRAQRHRRLHEPQIPRMHRFALGDRHQEDHAVLLCYARTQADLPEAYKVAHDTLIDMMGASRAGPVTWRTYTGPEANEALSRFWTPDTDPDLAAYYRRIKAMLREYGGFLVVTAAPGRRPLRRP